MAERIQLSEAEGLSAEGRIKSKTNAWLQNMSTIEKEVQSMASWFKGETGAALITLYYTCQTEIKKEIDQFITDYNKTLQKAIRSLMEADMQIASAIGKS